jgi:cytochrome c heme-lyase
MKRKGYNPAEEDVAVVLQIHNIVNEKGWSQIKEWEALRGWYVC